MLNRRSVLLASLAAGVAMTNKAHARAAQPATPVDFDVPALACDCHTHIHGDVEKFPFFAGRVYTPEPASPEEMAALHKALHIERVVIVTPSVYGTDNSSTLFGMKARGATARGVAVIDDKTTEAQLDAYAGGRFSRQSHQSRHRRRQRSECRPRALHRRRRAHEGARLARAALHHAADDLGDQGARAGFARAGCVRRFRRPRGVARTGAAGILRPDRARQDPGRPM